MPHKLALPANAASVGDFQAPCSVRRWALGAVAWGEEYYSPR